MNYLFGNGKKQTPEYLITSQCFGNKYIPIVPHWIKNTTEKCKTARIHIPEIPAILPFDTREVRRVNPSNPHTNITWSKQGEAFWDVLRLENNIEMLKSTRLPIMHCDLDVIVVKDLQPIVDFGKKENVDIVLSRETWGSPIDICSGLYILFPNNHAVSFFENWLNMMKIKKYNTYSDQNTLRSYIIENGYTIQDRFYIMKSKNYNHTMIVCNNIRICILDMELITRDPIKIRKQYANHINVDNVGGTNTFIRYFYEPMERLPLTCRCGKSHLGNNEICQHIGKNR